MISIRKSTFETNSSSTHAMAIPKKVDEWEENSFINDYNWRPLQFKLEDFGWEIKKVNHINYLYTAIVNTCTKYVKTDEKDKDGDPIYKTILTNDFDVKINQLKNCLKNHGIKYRFEKINLNNLKYIDHSEELDTFMNAVFESEESLWKYLIGGLVYTGTDNICEGDLEVYNMDFGPKFDTYHKGN